MAQKIYKLWLVRPKAAFYGRETELFAKIGEIEKRLGCQNIVACNSRWSNEQWSAFGVQPFPDLKTAQEHSRLLEEIHWPYEFVDSFSILGTEFETPESS